MKLVDIAKKLKSDVDGLRFGGATAYVYNPLDYAWDPHRIYLERFGKKPKEIVLVGMNPGPWGMVQTGVPFGDLKMVKEWMGIEAKVGRPKDPHPKRPVDGFECRRHEVSGRRLWGWAKDTFDKPERFFERFFVVNYCPLCFFDKDGGNRTPDKLQAEEKEKLFEVCDAALREVVDYLEPRYVLGVGRFAEGRAKKALKDLDIEIGNVPHPSPLNPQANEGWGKLMDQALKDIGVELD